MIADRIEPARTEAFAGKLMLGQTTVVPVLDTSETDMLKRTFDVFEIPLRTIENADFRRQIGIGNPCRTAFSDDSRQFRGAAGELRKFFSASLEIFDSAGEIPCLFDQVGTVLENGQRKFMFSAGRKLRR